MHGGRCRVVEQGRDGGRNHRRRDCGQQEPPPDRESQQEQEHRQAYPEGGADQGNAAAAGHQHTGGQKDQRHPGQPAAEGNDGPIGRLNRRNLIGLRDGDRPVHRRDSGGDRQVAGEQSRLDVLDDGSELDADRPVALGGDQGLRIVAQRGEKLRVADPEGALPALGEGLGGNKVLYPVPDDRLNLGWRFPSRRRARRSPADRFRVP